MVDRAPPRLVDYLDHMLEAAQLAHQYAGTLNETVFKSDRKTQQAIIYNLMILGEAAAKISVEYPRFTAEHQEVPWAMMRGMRNRMAHGYFQIDLAIVWATVRESLPPLQAQLISLRSSLAG